MQFGLDMLVNIFETIAGFALFFAIYRFPFKTLLPQTILSAVIMAQTSYVLRLVLDLENWTPFVMLLWMVILLRFLFQIHLFYSLLMAVTGYLLYGILQLILLLFVQNWFDYNEIIHDFYAVKALQVCSSSLSFIIAYLLFRYKMGFGFIPDRTNISVRFRGSNLRLLVVLISSCFLVSASVTFVNEGVTPPSIVITCISIAILPIAIILIRKELTNA